MSDDRRDLPVKEEFCDPAAPEPVPAEELDGLRLVPTALPDGIVVDVARPRRQGAGTCVDVGPALVLRDHGGCGDHAGGPSPASSVRDEPARRSAPSPRRPVGAPSCATQLRPRRRPGRRARP
jgi:hypothetical protein